jgi:hypothetical protein
MIKYVRPAKKMNQLIHRKNLLIAEVLPALHSKKGKPKDLLNLLKKNVEMDWTILPSVKISTPPKQQQELD